MAALLILPILASLCAAAPPISSAYDYAEMEVFLPTLTNQFEMGPIREIRRAAAPFFVIDDLEHFRQRRNPTYASVRDPQGRQGRPINHRPNENAQRRDNSFEEETDADDLLSRRYDDLAPCEQGYARRIDGKCVKPKILRRAFLFKAPQQKIQVLPPTDIPEPKINFNYVFIKSPSRIEGPGPLVIPPAQEKTLVYLLSENPENQEQQIIELEEKPDNPEVYFVDYKKGDNPVLPGGIDLQTALSKSIALTGSEDDETNVLPGKGGFIGESKSQGRFFGDSDSKRGFFSEIKGKGGFIGESKSQPRIHNSLSTPSSSYLPQAGQRINFGN